MLKSSNAIILFLTAQTISLLGSLVVQFAIVWYVTLVTESATMLAVSSISGFLPQLAVSMLAGVWIDKYDRKKVIIVADVFTALLTTVLAILFYFQKETMPIIFAVLALRALATGVQMPAVNALIPQIVEKENLMRINGINSALNSGMMLIAPLLGGLLLNYVSFAVLLFSDIITAIIGVSFLMMIKITPLIQTEQGYFQIKQWWRNTSVSVRQGWAYLRENPLIKRVLLFQFVILFLISPSAFLNPLLVSKTFGGDINLLSYAEAVYSLGMVVGGAIVVSLNRVHYKLRIMFFAAALYGGCMIALGCAEVFSFYLMVNFMAGVVVPCYNAPVTTLIQERVALLYQGRIFGFLQFVTAAALPLGIAIFSYPANLYGVDVLFVINGLLCGLSSLIVWLLFFRKQY